MSNTVAGYFNKQNDYKKIESDLEGAGFSRTDYTVFLNEDSDRYLVSVLVKDDVEIDNVKAIFKNNGVTNDYFFEGLSKPAYEDLKNLIEERAKAEIANTPELNIKTTSDGIDSEVNFGE